MHEATPTDTELDVAIAHHEAGRLLPAEAMYRSVLEADANNADALNLLGVLLQDTGRLEDSIAVLNRAVAADPAFPEAFANLARAQCAAGDAFAARDSSRRAIALDPELAAAHLQLARASLDLNDPQTSRKAALQALDLTPESADAELYLGHALAKLKDHAAAAAAYRNADRLAPNQFVTLVNLGLALSELTQHEPALRHCRQALTLAPGDARVHAAIGLVLRRAGDIPGSIGAHARALAIDPGQPELWLQLGICHGLLGQFPAAADCYKRVLDLEPESMEAVTQLAGIRGLDGADSGRAALQAALIDTNRSDRERASAGFALGALLDREGDFDAAFAAFSTANRLIHNFFVAAGMEFDRASLHNWIEDIRTAFDPAAFLDAGYGGDPSEIPLFIVGMPRSGTTLIEQILASHPKVFSVGETTDIAAIAARLQAGQTKLIPTEWDPAVIRREAEAHLQKLQAIGGSAERVIDKLPDNILFLGHIALLYPNARIIFSRRDSRDVCLSCFFQPFQDDIPWAYDMADCAARTSEIERLAEHWRATLKLRMLEVDYESVVSDLEGESRRLIDFLGLDWDEACLNFHATDRAVHTASFWQVRQKLYSSSVGRWRRYRRHIQPILEGLAAGSGTAPSMDEAAWRRHIERHPDDGDALGALGGLLLAKGSAAEATAVLQRAVAAKPVDAVLLVDLARAHRMMGNTADSAAAAEAAAGLNPDDASAQFLLGAARLDLGDAAGALPALERAVALAPQSRDARLFLAMAWMRLKQLDTAVTALRDALSIHPDDTECLAKLARLLGELRHFDEALTLARRAVDLAPGDGLVHLSLVTVLWLSGDIPAALAAAEAALRLAPNIAELWLHTGYCQTSMGRFAEAEICYRKALAINPELEAAHFGLVRIGLGADAQQDLDRLESVLTDANKEDTERVAAGHALGELLDRVGDYDGAWRAYHEANRLATIVHQKTVRAFDPVAFDTHIETLIETFSAEFFKSLPHFGDPSDTPVFVVGMPRSGTTLLEQIACSHKLVFGAGELDDMHAIANRLDANDAYLLEADPAVIAAEAAGYLAKIRALGGEAKRVIDKMPDNFQWLGHIAALFPNARVIVCRRDYRDVALSCLFQNFGDNLSWSTDVLDIAARIRGFDRLAAHWRAVLPIPILEIQYEDLVSDLEAGSRRLIDFLGLPWDPACLEFHETQRPVMTASSWQVRQPLYTSSMERWRHYQGHLGLLLAGLAGLVPSDGSEDWDGLAAYPVKAITVALSLHRAGQLDRPEPIYQALLRRDPGDPTALHLLGLLRIDQGKPADAIVLLSRSLAKRPDSAPVLADVARAQCAAGNAAAAIEAADRALSLDPTLLDGWLNLGCARLMQQDTEGAVGALRRASMIAPDSVEVWATLAAALTERKDFAGSLKAWEAAVQLRPADPTVLRGHAGMLAEMKRYPEALAAFRQVDELAPGQPAVVYGIAGALLHTGDVPGALAMCRLGLDIVQDARFWLLLSNCEAILGHFDAAADACRKALDLDPGMTGALRDLVALGARADDESAESAARGTLEDATRSIRDRATAGFTLGQLRDRRGAYDDAFAAYTLANHLLREDRNAHGFQFDRAGFRDLIDRQIAAFDPRTFAASAGWGSDSDVPVFIVGMPRSGTSLVEQILASHPSVFGAGELTDIFAILGALDDKNGHSPPVAWNPVTARLRADAHVDHLRGLGGAAIRVIDKQPDNILCLGQIAVLFPKARIVVCRRDPRDICLSCYFQLFRDDPMVWTDDLGDCAFRMREIARLLAHWRAVLPIEVIEIDYETLVEDLENQSRRLIDFLGLDWDPACLDFHQTERTVMTASHWQVRQPLYTGSAGRWRHYSQYLGPMLRELGSLVPDGGV